MKKYLIIPLAALLACSREIPAEMPELVPMSFTAYPESLVKTTLGADYSIRWSTSDQITLFSSIETAGAAFQVAATEDEGKVATFTGLTPVSAIGYYYALSPASDEARLKTADGTFAASLPTSQTGVENSFATNANLSVAQVNAEALEDNNILHFKNTGALLSFLVPGNYITRIRIQSRNPEVAMSGLANIDYNGGLPIVNATSQSKNYIEVTVPSGSIGKRFYAVVFPGNYDQGFHVTFYNSAGQFNRYSSTKGLNLGRNDNIRLIERNWGIDDDRATRTVSGTELIAPVISTSAASAANSTIFFSCGSGVRDTYYLYVRDYTSMGTGTKVGELYTGSGQYGSFNYTFKNLTEGVTYDLGVGAVREGYSESVTWLEDVTISTSVKALAVSIDETAQSYYNMVVGYTLDGVTSTGVEHGLVFSYSSSDPTCGLVGTAGKLPGPVLTATGKVSFTQCVPNAVLRPGDPCYVRAYCYDTDSGNYVYSPVSTLTLSEQPEGYSIVKSSTASPSAAVELYSFTANGSYHGWYAAADCSSSSSVRLGVNNAPMGTASALSMSSQASTSGSLVLLNGQIFGSQGNIGLAYTGGNLRYNNSSDDGIANCRGFSNTYSAWQPVTRAILGVNADGVPGAFWCSLIDGTPYFFDRPIPAGTASPYVYPQVTASSGPGPAQSWSPQEALSTGPMLLYGGNVCVSEDKIATGVFYTNYELWETTSGNIYGSSRNRSAIGYNASTGKIFLVAVTSNVTMTQMARIMKGLGCDYAMALDGGGSTQMYVKNTGGLTGNSRNVKSTVGFFQR